MIFSDDEPFNHLHLTGKGLICKRSYTEPQETVEMIMMVMVAMLTLMVMVKNLKMMTVNKARLTRGHLPSSHFAQLGQWRALPGKSSLFKLTKI